MDILSQQNLFDLLVILLLAAAFILGYLQGTVRRAIGIAAVLFSLILASHLRLPIGDYLASNWSQFPPGYARMLAFGGLFAISVIVLAVIAEIYYERGPFLPRARLADPILGGVLGVVQGMLLILVLVLVIDSYFSTPDLIVSAAEFVVIRDFSAAVDVSRTAALFRHDLIPALFALIGFFIPEDLRALYPR